MATMTKLNQNEMIPLKTDEGALANRINKETRQAHNKIDKMISIRLAIALKDPKMYRQGVQSFYHVFASIERNLEKQFNAGNEWSSMLKEIWKPAIARTEKCERDLMFYYDERPEKFKTPMLSEQIEFSRHIDEVTSKKPYLLLAYMHVMYLALFAGGRIMRSSVSKATGLFPQKKGYTHEDIVSLGANLYSFDVEDEDFLRVEYKRDYELATRNGLTEEQKLEIIEESKYIFEQNAKCISEIEKHNLVKLRKKWSYLVVTNSSKIGITFLVLIILFYLRNILASFI